MHLYVPACTCAHRIRTPLSYPKRWDPADKQESNPTRGAAAINFAQFRKIAEAVDSVFDRAARKDPLPARSTADDQEEEANGYEDENDMQEDDNHHRLLHYHQSPRNCKRKRER